ncbi:MAG: carbonic anhydrase family protein [Propionivibrio sp.]
MPIVFLLSLLLSTAANATQWSRIATKDKVRLEVDRDSVIKGEAGKLKLWHREVHAAPKVPDSGAFTFIKRTLLTEFNCDKRTTTLVRQLYTAPDGSELKAEAFDGTDAQPVQPDSAMEIVFNYACRQLQKAEVASPAEMPPAATPPVAAAAAAPTEAPPAAPPPETPEKKPAKGKKGKEEPPPPHVTPHWTYSGANGADKWGSLDNEFATCGVGQRQSPIDIRRTVKADLPPIQFAYKPVPLAIVNNGHSIKVDTPNAGGISVDGESYELVQFHFHKPSEEKINGKTYDMVVHLVHQSKSGKLAVIAVLMEAGKEQKLIRTLWTHLPLEQEKPVVRDDVKVDPTQLIPPKSGYYTFLGSLTTPPCSEGVLWLVMKTPLQVSKEQLASFGTVYKNNARPIQPSNGRVIKESR